MLGVGIILVAFGLGSVRSDWDKIKAAQSGSAQVQREFEGIDNIEVDVPLGYVEVIASEDDKVHFEAVNVNADALKIRQEGGKLKIDVDSKKGEVMGLVSLPMMLESELDDDGNFTMQRYQLSLPEDYRGKLELELNTGRLWICGICAGELDVCVDAGELVVTECSAEKLDAECNVGECSVDGIFQDISAKTHIGVLNSRIYGSYEAYNGAITCNIGELEYHMGVEEESSFGDSIIWVEEWDRNGGIGVRKTWKGASAKGKLEIECGIGNVTVVFAGAGSRWQEKPELAMADISEEAIPKEDMAEENIMPEEAVPKDSAAAKTVDKPEAGAGFEIRDERGE